MTHPIASLGAVGTFIAGSGFPLNLQGKTSGQYPFAKVGDISRCARSGRDELGDAEHWVDDGVVTQLNAKVIPAHAILFAKIGEAIRQNFRVIASRPLLIDNNAMAYVVDRDLLDVRYAFHFLKSTDMYFLASSTTVPSLRKSTLESIAISLPPLPEQRRIAAILDKADALRAKRREAIAKLDQLLQSVFLDMFGDPVANPREWPIGCIGDMLESVKYGTSEKASPDGPVPILRMNNITAIGEMELTDLKYVNLPTKELEKYLVRPGDLLFNRTNSKELVGKTAVYDGPEPMAFAGYLVRGRVSDRYSPEYISAYLNSRWGKQKLRGMCKSIVGMANINAQEFAGISIAIPSSEAQQRFARLVSGMRARKRDLREQMRAFNRLFSALQSNAFSGA